MLTKSKFDVSAVVATYGRPDQCIQCVNSLLEALRDVPLVGEIIIGINGPDKKTAEVLQAELKKRKGKTEVHVLPFPERESPSGFRNRLMESARGEWIFFIDDDAFVDPDFFLKFIRAKDSNQNISVIGGPNLTPPHSRFFQKATGVALASRLATYFSSSRYKAAESSKICGEESLILCNLLIKKEALWPNPFLKELICCEESWLLMEMGKKGFQLLYDGSLYVWHERRSHIFSLSRQVFKYGFGRGQILRKDPSGLRPAHVLPSLCVFYTLILAILLALHRPVPFIWFSPFIIYFILCTAVAFKSSKRADDLSLAPSTAMVAILFPLIHFFYGLGLFWGLVRG